MEVLKELSTKLRPTKRMPLLFVGHGSPMRAISDDDATRTWAKLGAELPEAQAYVAVSAHWLTRGTLVTDNLKPRTIHDFGGFPQELYDMKYDADGDPAIAEEIRRKLLSWDAKLDGSWGLDHGTWSVLRHMKPKPDAPILQLSLDGRQSFEQLWSLFQELRSLREQGVIFIGSGNIVHNLGLIRFEKPDGFDWAQEFDDKVAHALAEGRWKDLLHPESLDKAARLALPTDEHYRPLLSMLALMDQGEVPEAFNDFVEFGSLSMRSFIAR